ncbi:hypothetical protein DL96DRAFT_1714997 [Flagelloscypha sp. PMI_526]|nr:hypothetical protein DL96DRAFT_1714997 [Flagelloscypha sp. PMI_526]
MGRPPTYFTPEERLAARRQANIAYKERNRDHIRHAKAKYRLTARLVREEKHIADAKTKACISEVESVAIACSQARAARVPTSKRYTWSQMRDPEVVRMQEAKKCFDCLVIIAQDILGTLNTSPRHYFDSLVFLISRTSDASLPLAQFESMHDYLCEAKSDAHIEHDAIYQLTGVSSLHENAGLYIAWIEEIYEAVIDIQLALLDGSITRRASIGAGSYCCNIAEQMGNLEHALRVRECPQAIPNSFTGLAKVAGIACIKENYSKPALYLLPNPKEDLKLWYGVGILYGSYGLLGLAEEAFLSVLRMNLDFDKTSKIRASHHIYSGSYSGPTEMPHPGSSRNSPGPFRDDTPPSREHRRLSELDPNNTVITQRLQLLRQAQATGQTLPSPSQPQGVHAATYASITGPLVMNGPNLLA